MSREAWAAIRDGWKRVFLVCAALAALASCSALASFLGIAAPIVRDAGEVLEAVNRSRLAAGLGPLPPQDPRYAELVARVQALEEHDAKDKAADEAREKAEVKDALENALEETARAKERTAALKRQLAAAIRAAKAATVAPVQTTPPPAPADAMRGLPRPVDAGADQ